MSEPNNENNENDFFEVEDELQSPSVPLESAFEPLGKYAIPTPEEVEKNLQYDESSQEYDMKMLNVLQYAKDLPKYYPPLETDFDTSQNGYYQSIEKAITSDGDRHNFSWILGLNKQQLDEWANLDSVMKNNIENYAHFLHANYNTKERLQTTARRRVSTELNSLISGKSITAFGYVPPQETLDQTNERIKYLSNQDNFNSEVDKIFEILLQEETYKVVSELNPNAEMAEVLKLQELKQSELGYVKNILPIASQIGDQFLKFLNPQNVGTPEEQRQKVQDFSSIGKDLEGNWAERTITTIGVIPTTFLYLTFGVVSRTGTAFINKIAPNWLEGMQTNREENEIRDIIQAEGDVTSRAYADFALYSWDDIKQNYPELAQTYLEIADGDEFKASALYMTQQLEASADMGNVIGDYVGTQLQQRQDEFARILESKNSLGELLVSGFASYNKYAVGSYMTGAAGLMFDEDLKDVVYGKSYDEAKKELKKYIKKNDYRPSAAVGWQNTAAGNAIDITLSIVGDPLTWLLTPGPTTTATTMLRQFSNANKIRGFVNQSFVGRQIIKEMFETGVKYHKGLIPVKSYAGLFSGFDIGTQAKLKNILLESIEQGDKAPTQLFKSTVVEAMLAGQEPLHAYKTLTSMLAGQMMRKLTTGTLNMSWKYPKKLHKLKQMHTAQANMKQLSVSSPTFVKDVLELASNILGATVDDFAQGMAKYDEFFEMVHKQFTDVAENGVGTNLDEVQKAQQNLMLSSDWMSALEVLTGNKIRPIVSGLNQRVTKESLIRSSSLDEAFELSGTSEGIKGVITSLNKKIDDFNSEIARAKKVQKELKNRSDQLSKSEKNVLKAQSKIISTNSTKVGKIKKKIKVQEKKLKESLKEVPESAEIVVSKDLMIDGVFNRKTLVAKLKKLKSERKNLANQAAKAQNKLDKDLEKLQKYLQQLRNEQADIQKKINFLDDTASKGAVEKLENALNKKTNQINKQKEGIEKIKQDADLSGVGLTGPEQAAKLAMYDEEVSLIESILKRKATVKQEGKVDDYVALDKNLGLASIQENASNQVPRIIKEMLEEGTQLSDDVLGKKYEKLLERYQKIDNLSDELKSDVLKGKLKDPNGEFFNYINKQYRIARRTAALQVKKLQTLQSASPKNNIMQALEGLYEDLAINTLKWGKVQEWKAQKVIKLSSGRVRKATKKEIANPALANEIFEIPGVVELVGKNKYVVNWDVLKMHLRFDSELTDVSEALLKQGRIGRGPQAKLLEAPVINKQKAVIEDGVLNYKGRKTDLSGLDNSPDWLDSYDTVQRVLKSRNQLVTGELPLSPLEFILANQAANGGLVGRAFRSMEASDLYRTTQWLNNLWILDKVAKPSTGVISNADELMFYNSFGNWKEYIKQSYRSKLDANVVRRYSRKLSKGQDVSDDLAKKYEAWQTRTIQNIQELPVKLQQRGQHAAQKFNDNYEFLVAGDSNYFEYMIGHVNGLLDDYGFRFYATGNKEAFKAWYATPDANYIRGNSVIKNVGTSKKPINNFYAYEGMSADDAWDLYEGLKHYYAVNLNASTADSLWDALKVAAVKRGNDPKALPPTSILTKMQVPGVPGRPGGRMSKVLFGNKGKKFLESAFADPARFREGFIARTAAKNKESNLRELFESQGKQIIDSRTLDKFKASSSALDPAYQADMFGASFFDYDLFRQGYVTEDYIKAMGQKAAIDDVNKYMLNYHLTTPIGRTARQVFPFGKPWLDFTKRYMGDLGKRMQIKGLDIAEDSNIFTKMAYNAQSMFPNLRRGAYISRVANADLSTQQADFEPFVFLPNGDNFFWVSVPGFGLLPAGALSIISENTDNEEYKKIIETIFPYTMFNPDAYQLINDPEMSLYNFVVGGGVVDYARKGIQTTFGMMDNKYNELEAQPFNDSLTKSRIQRDQRDTFYNDFDMILQVIGNFDDGEPIYVDIAEQAAAAEMSALSNLMGKDLTRYTIPARISYEANFLDTADNWIDYFKSDLEELLRPDTYALYERNPNEPNVKVQVNNELRNWWYKESSTAEKLNLGLENPAIYVLVQAGYEVTDEGSRFLHLPEHENSPFKYGNGDVYRAYNYTDQDQNERYQDYVQRNWITPRKGDDVLGYAIHKYYDVQLDAAKYIKEQAAKILSDRTIDFMTQGGAVSSEEIFPGFEEEYYKQAYAYVESVLPDNIGFVSTDLSKTDNTSDKFLNSYFSLSDFDEDTQRMITNLGLEDMFKDSGGTVNGTKLNNALIGVKSTITNTPAYIETTQYKDGYTRGTKISFRQYIQGERAWVDNGGFQDWGDTLDKSRYIEILETAEVLFSLYIDEDFGQESDEFQYLREHLARAYMDWAHEARSAYNPNDNNIASWDAKWNNNLASWAGPLDWKAPLPPNVNDGADPDIFTFNVSVKNIYENFDVEINTLEALLPKDAVLLNSMVSDVIDGDTIRLDPNLPIPTSLRTIGIMANETNHPDGTISSEGFRQKFALEEIVHLTKGRLYYIPDQRFGNSKNGKDPYGRVLGWLFVEGGLDGSLPAGLGEYLYFEDHFKPTDGYYRRGSELGPFSDIIEPNYQEFNYQTSAGYAGEGLGLVDEE